MAAGHFEEAAVIAAAAAAIFSARSSTADMRAADVSEEVATTAGSPTSNVRLSGVRCSNVPPGHAPFGYPLAENICVGIIEANSWLSVIKKKYFSESGI